jgi:hypothetical protein
VPLEPVEVVRLEPLPEELGDGLELPGEGLLIEATTAATGRPRYPVR